MQLFLLTSKNDNPVFAYLLIKNDEEQSVE
jgi:hypothetical protein